MNKEERVGQREKSFFFGKEKKIKSKKLWTKQQSLEKMGGRERESGHFQNVQFSILDSCYYLLSF